MVNSGFLRIMPIRVHAKGDLWPGTIARADGDRRRQYAQGGHGHGLHRLFAETVFVPSLVERHQQGHDLNRTSRRNARPKLNEHLLGRLPICIKCRAFRLSAFNVGVLRSCDRYRLMHRSTPSSTFFRSANRHTLNERNQCIVELTPR